MMQRQRYTVIGTKNGYNVKDFIMAYSETEAKLIYKRSRPDVEVTECYITKANDWHKTAQEELEQGYNSLKDKIDDGCIRAYEVRCTDIIDNKPVLEIHSQLMRRKIDFKQEEEQPKEKLMTLNIKCKDGWVGSDE